MINIKGFAIATDGTVKRIALTYDVIGDDGKVVKPNVRLNRVVTDENVLSSIEDIETFCKTLVEE